MSLVLALSAPAFGGVRDGDDWVPKNPIVKILKKLLATLGDGLIIPTP